MIPRIQEAAEVAEVAEVAEGIETLAVARLKRRRKELKTAILTAHGLPLGTLPGTSALNAIVGVSGPRIIREDGVRAKPRITPSGGKSCYCTMCAKPVLPSPCFAIRTSGDSRRRRRRGHSTAGSITGSSSI